MAVAAALLLLAVVAGCEKEPKPDKSASLDFSLTDLSGNIVKLVDYKGKVVMLEFWTTWCPPCKLSIPTLNMLHERYKDKDFKLLALSIDETKETLMEFSEEFTMNYTVLLDNKDVNKAYGVRSIPTTIILDKEGNVAKKHMGYSSQSAEQYIKDIEELLR